MRSLEHRIPPPVAFLVAAGVMWWGGRLGPPSRVPGEARLIVAVVLSVIGLASVASGVIAFRRHRTTTNPIRIDAVSSLVTGGVYRLTRNPMYLGLALLLSAWAAYLGTPWMLLGPAGLVAYLTRFQIVPEERVMLEKFGAAYDAYRRSVRRWL